MLTIALPSRGHDIAGVLPDAWDQPRANFVLRRAPDADPLVSSTWASLGDDVFNIEAFLDTGASSIVLSTGQGLLGPGTADDFGVGTTGARFFDVGLDGSTEFGISETLYLSLAPSHPLAEVRDRTLLDGVYRRTIGPVRTQIGPIQNTNSPLGNLAGSVDVLGMPVLFGNVAVLDPRPVDAAAGLDIFEILNLDPTALPLMRSYIYAPGTPFKPRWTDQDPNGPGIPPTERHVALSYASFERYVQVVPPTADRPTFSPNPMIGPNPVPSPTGGGEPATEPPGVTVRFRDRSTTGSFLVDTGAADSFLSTAMAAVLNIRYRPGSSDPVLEVFDPANPGASGEEITGFVREVTGIGGGAIILAGFYADSLLVRTVEGDADDDEDPNHLRFTNAPVLVFDLTLKDPETEETLTLDGIFGMNFLVASTDFSTNCLLAGTCPTRTSAFNWTVLDFSSPDSGLLGLDLKEVFRLYQGLNLFSYPSDVPARHGTCKKLLSSLGGPDEIASITRLDAAARRYETCTHTGGANFAIATGEGYAVDMRTSKEVVLPGDGSCQSLVLASGANLIGHPAPRVGLTCYKVLLEIGSGAVSSLRRFNPYLGAFETCAFSEQSIEGTPVGADFVLQRGEGYILYSRIDGAIRLPGCAN